MDFKKTSTSILVAILIGLSSLTILSFRSKESDDAALNRIKFESLKAPNIEYPTNDISGRKIPTVDYVVVFPDCTSCSDFRKKSRDYMESNPGKFFLILTPDRVGIDALLNRNRYFVSLYTKDSPYAELLPGMYTK